MNIYLLRIQLFGPVLKKAGFDALIIEGRSEEPVYLVVDKNEIRIEDAANLWGKGALETTDILWKKYGNVPVAAIGPGGENLVRFANIVALLSLSLIVKSL